MKSIIRYIALFFVGSASLAVAQENTGNLSDAQLIIEKKTVLELPIAIRGFSKMSVIPGTERGGAPGTFNRKLLNPKVSDINPTLTPIKQSGNDRAGYSPTAAYLKAGIGNYFTSNLEGLYSGGSEDEFLYGAQFSHLASRNGPVDESNSGSSQNSIDFFGKYFLEAGSFTGKIGYERNRNFFYGYDSLTALREIDRDSIRQTYQIFSAGLRFDRKVDVFSSFRYGVSADFYRLTDEFEASENNFDLGFDGRYELNDEAYITFDAHTIFNQRTDSISNNRNLYKFGAAYHYLNGPFQVTAGVRVAYNADSLFVDNQFRLYPNLQLKYQVVENQLALLIGITGDMEQQTLRSLSQENPWIGPRVNLAHNDRNLDASVGVEANIAQKVGVRVKAGLARYKNMPFFVNSPTDQAKFDVVFDGKSVGVLNAQADITAQFGRFRGMWTTGFFKYSLDTLAEAWHKPTAINNFVLSFKASDKLLLGADLYHLGGIRAQHTDNQTVVKLDNIVDLNLKADYSIGNGFSAFLSLNNIFSQNYQRYQFYQVRGFMALVGITYTLSEDRLSF